MSMLFDHPLVGSRLVDKGTVGQTISGTIIAVADDHSEILAMFRPGTYTSVSRSKMERYAVEMMEITK